MRLRLTILAALATAIPAREGRAEMAPASPAKPAATAVAVAGPETPPANDIRARLLLSHVLSDDDVTARHLSFSDLRLTTDGKRLFDLPLELHLDGRGRRAWNELSDDRLSVTEAYVRMGDASTDWRMNVGRQLVLPLAAAELDGLLVERQMSPGLVLFVAGGLQPHPFTGAPNIDFYGAGGGYDLRGESSNHSGGVMLSMFGAALDRLYITQRSYKTFGRELVLSGFVIVDIMAPRGIFSDTGDPTDAKAGPDLTTFNGLLRYRPTRWLDTSLTVSHHHTLLPNKWWRDWLAEERRKRGFAIDGDEPVGTRISSARWTTNFAITPELVPYVRARYDIRHTSDATGTEGRAGFKFRPRTGYGDVSYAYRDYFGTRYHLAELRGGIDRELGGGEAGAIGLRSTSDLDGRTRMAYSLHALGWLAIGRLLSDADGTPAGFDLSVQYQVFIEPALVFHTVFVQLGYRL